MKPVTEPVRPETGVPGEASGNGETSASTRFGPALREAREARGLTLRELAQTTAIRRDYLQALEEAQPLADGRLQLGVLPEATFARAYLRTYARELGLDPAPLLADFDRLSRPGLPPPKAAPAEAAEEYAPPLGPTRIALIAVLLILLLTVGVLLLRGAAPAAVVPPPPIPVPASPTPPPVLPPTPPAVPPPPVVPQGTVRLSVKSVPDGAVVYLDNRNLGQAPVLSFPVDARARAELRVEAAGRTPLKQTIDLRQGRNLRATLPATVSPSGTRQPSVLTDLNTGVTTLTPLPPLPAAPPASRPGSAPGPAAANAVTLRFVGQSWARVTGDGGRVLYEGIPPMGSVQTYPPGVSVRAGNAGAVRVSVGGAPETALGEAGQVLTRQF
ncbi:RodZ domain-containing protein [Deinococcus marmoris]